MTWRIDAVDGRRAVPAARAVGDRPARRRSSRSSTRSSPTSSTPTRRRARCSRSSSSRAGCGSRRASCRRRARCARLRCATRIRAAWGVEPHEIYGATDGLWGSTCAHHNLHFAEDHTIVEVEDERLLITNLFMRTQPVIRYEITDIVRIDDEPCPCGTPFRTVARDRGTQRRHPALRRRRGAPDRRSARRWPSSTACASTRSSSAPTACTCASCRGDEGVVRAVERGDDAARCARRAPATVPVHVEAVDGDRARRGGRRQAQARAKRASSCRPSSHAVTSSAGLGRQMQVALHDVAAERAQRARASRRSRRPRRRRRGRASGRG